MWTTLQHIFVCLCCVIAESLLISALSAEMLSVYAAVFIEVFCLVAASDWDSVKVTVCTVVSFAVSVIIFVNFKVLTGHLRPKTL